MCNTEKKQPEWEYRPLKLTGTLKEVIQATIKASEAELEMLRNKLKKLTYGG